jgi:hypothetical protein
MIDRITRPCLPWMNNTEHKNVFLHIPGLKITQIKIPRNVVGVFGTLTTWRHTMHSHTLHKRPSLLARGDLVSGPKCKHC